MCCKALVILQDKDPWEEADGNIQDDDATGVTQRFNVTKKREINPFSPCVCKQTCRYHLKSRVAIWMGFVGLIAFPGSERIAEGFLWFLSINRS